jgi:uncharacterized protein (TIGR02391 family)
MLGDRERLLALEPEELAWEVLEELVTLNARGETQGLHRGNFLIHLMGHRPDRRDAIACALVEAWVWLEREGMIAPAPGQDGDWIIVTRRGERLRARDDFRRYQFSNVLPRGQLHPVLADRIWPTFLRGDYDTAVFQAFREVEIAVRRAAGLADTDIGTDLMRRAFSPGRPLADPEAPLSEQEALAHLFAGAIGSYKNPQSHRAVNLTDPVEAAEIIAFASQLLRIVDRRGAQGA